jgi:hypothetical protein
MTKKDEKLQGLKNYQSRTRLWKDDLLNNKFQNEESIRNNSAKIKLMQRQTVIIEKQIDLINEELTHADKELIKTSEEIKELEK